MSNRAVAAAAVVLASAGAAFGQAFINVPTTNAAITYRAAAGGAPTQSWATNNATQWFAPNFLTSGVFQDNDGAGNTNSGFTAISYFFANAPVPGPLTPFAAGVVIPQASFFSQNDPAGARGRASLRIDFQIDVVGVNAANGGVGFQLTSLPGFYNLAFNIPAGSFGQFDAQINYTSLLTGLAALPTQNMNFGGAGVNGAGVAALAFPGAGFNYLAVPGEIVRVGGFIEWQVDNETGPVSLELTEVPAPGAAALLGLSGLLAARRRRN